MMNIVNRVAILCIPLVLSWHTAFAGEAEPALVVQAFTKDTEILRLYGTPVPPMAMAIVGDTVIGVHGKVWYQSADGKVTTYMDTIGKPLCTTQVLNDYAVLTFGSQDMRVEPAVYMCVPGREPRVIRPRAPASMPKAVLQSAATAYVKGGTTFAVVCTHKGMTFDGEKTVTSVTVYNKDQEVERIELENGFVYDVLRGLPSPSLMVDMQPDKRYEVIPYKTNEGILDTGPPKQPALIKGDANGAPFRLGITDLNTQEILGGFPKERVGAVYQSAGDNVRMSVPFGTGYAPWLPMRDVTQKTIVLPYVYQHGSQNFMKTGIVYLIDLEGRQSIPLFYQTLNYGAHTRFFQCNNDGFSIDQSLLVRTKRTTAGIQVTGVLYDKAVRFDVGTDGRIGPRREDVQTTAPPDLANLQPPKNPGMARNDLTVKAGSSLPDDLLQELSLALRSDPSLAVMMQSLSFDGNLEKRIMLDGDHRISIVMRIQRGDVQIGETKERGLDPDPKRAHRSAVLATVASAVAKLKAAAQSSMPKSVP
jgi:hypothetical protein